MIKQVEQLKEVTELIKWYEKQDKKLIIGVLIGYVLGRNSK